jgi:anti-sigma factor RsiW
MTRWTHRRLRRKVSAFVDGELDLVTATAIERHVGRCWGCSSAVEQFRLIKASLQHIGHGQPDALGAARLRRWATGLPARGDWSPR